MFISFSLIELTNVGAGLIDGLVVSHFLNAKSMAAAGIAHTIFSIAGVFGGMFAAGMQALCTKELGRGDTNGFNRVFSAAMYLGTAFSTVITVILFAAAINDSTLDPEEKLGLRILGGMADDIRYVHSLEMNNVILHFPL